MKPSTIDAILAKSSYAGATTGEWYNMQHVAAPHIAKIVGPKARPVHECEGGGVYYSPHDAALLGDAKLNAAKAIVAEQLARALEHYAPKSEVHPDWYNEPDKQTVAALTAWRELISEV